MLPASVRLAGAALGPARAVGEWLWAGSRRTWTVPVLIAAVGFLTVHPFDSFFARTSAQLAGALGGDVRRELHAWQQFGAAGSIVFVSVVMLAGNRVRARRLLDLYLSIGAAGIICTLMKLGIGRPRPRDHFEDAHTFLGPLGVYPVPGADGRPRLVHAWSAHGERVGSLADLWSMPSSHTVYAVVLAVFLIAVFPRLRWLWVLLAALVGCCRLIFDAHWATDVVVGAGVGAAVGWTIVSRFAGVRLVDQIWRWVVDPRARPSEPLVRRAYASGAGL